MYERRPLSQAEKDHILQVHGPRCFIDGAPVDMDELEFDHIRPVASLGPTEVGNLAPVCRRHNRQKGTMALSEYRDKLSLQDFFSDGQPKYLNDVIRAKGSRCGARLKYEMLQEKNSVILYFEESQTTVSLYQCPTTGWPYFYALIPISHLDNDKDLQPRPLREDSLWALYRHFLRNTQLAPSICRIDDSGNLLLFDGQHKAAAQVWSGRKSVECKVYVRPVARLLKETNIEAHQTYRQMSFYSAELIRKYADIFGEDWEEYLAQEGPKSEQGFVNFLVGAKGKTTTRARRELASAIYSRILNDPNNKLGDFIAEKSRARRQPLTYNRIEKTIFVHLLSPVPTEVEFQAENDFREAEERNLVQLMNIIAEEGLNGRWNPELGDDLHKRTERAFSAGSVRAWVQVLRDVTYAYLQLYLKGPQEAKRVLYRELSDENFDWIRRFIRQIFAHPVWDAPDTPDGEFSKALTKDDDVTAMSVLRRFGLVTEWVLETAGRT